MLGVAVLGAGDIANTHIEAFCQLKNRCRIIALADVNIRKAEEKKEKYALDCDVTDDYRSLLEREDIQIVSICLPPALHCRAAVEFLDRGKHVLCEKPMAVSLEECDQMLKSAEKGHARLGIVAQNRFKQDVMKTKKLIDQRALGRLLYAQANSLWWRGDHYYDLCWRGTWEKEGGGCTFIHAVHHIDLFLWMMGEVESLQAMVDNQNHSGSEVEDVSMCMVRFKSGAAGTLVSSLLHHGEKQNLFIDGVKGSIEIPYYLSVSKQLQNGYPVCDEDVCRQLEEQYEAIPDLKYTGHTGQIEDFVAAVEQDREPLVSGKDGRLTMEFITAVYQSAFLGCRVNFPMTEADPFYSKEGILKHTVKFHEKTKSVDSFADIGISVGGTL